MIGPRGTMKKSLTKPFTILRRLRRWSGYPRLALPLQRGPLHGFYHFLLGYFVPVYLWKSRHPQAKLAVMDFGPMSRWFDVLPGSAPTVLEQGDVIRLGIRGARSGFAGGYRLLRFEDWDRADRMHERPLSVVRELVLASLDVTESAKPSRPQIVWVTRDYRPEFFDQHPRRRYGISKRDLPNTPELVDAVSQLGEVSVLDGAAASPEEMISACSRADILIGQHGAGLSNSLFLQPNSQVFEIGVRSGPEGKWIHYQKMALALGLRWEWFGLQDTWFSPVAIDEFLLRASRLIDRTPKT